MRLLVMRPLGKLSHRAVARVSMIRRIGPHLRKLEQYAFADSVTRDRDLSRLESRHRFRDDRKSGDNDVRPRCVESRYCLPLDGAQRDQIVDEMLELGARHDGSMDCARGENTLPGCDHAAEIGERSAGSDYAGPPPVASREIVAQAAADKSSKLSQRRLRDAFAEIFLGEPYRSERKRHEALDQAVCAEGELHRSTADVDDHRAAGCEVEVSLRAPEAEPRLVFAREHRDGETGLVFDSPQPFHAVLRLADRARCDGAPPFGTKLRRELRHVAENT